jgi:hypothetical protein
MGMPIRWTVFHSTRDVVISIVGAARLQEMEEYVENVMTPATRSYRKLVNMTQGHLAVSREDMATLAARVRDLGGSGPMGAVAIAVESDESERQVCHFESLSLVDRPLKIFRDLQAARAWLDTQPSRAVPPWLEEPMPTAQPDEAAPASCPASDSKPPSR